MPTIGNAAKPTSTYHAYGGSSTPNQEAELLEMPVRGELLELGSWIGGWADTCRVRLCVWDEDGNLLGQSATVTVANEGAASTGNISLYTEPLSSPVELPKGAAFYVGFMRHPDDAHQVSVGPSSTGPHYHGRSFLANWPAGDLGERTEGISEETRRVGSYVANYEPIPGAQVYRSGSWVPAETVQVYRSGSWVDVESVQVYRSGSWVDAE